MLEAALQLHSEYCPGLFKSYFSCTWAVFRFQSSSKGHVAGLIESFNFYQTESWKCLLLKHALDCFSCHPAQHWPPLSCRSEHTVAKSQCLCTFKRFHIRQCVYSFDGKLLGLRMGDTRLPPSCEQLQPLIRSDVRDSIRAAEKLLEWPPGQGHKLKHGNRAKDSRIPTKTLKICNDAHVENRKWCTLWK